MKTEPSTFADQLARLDKQVMAAVAAGRTFNPTFLYQDGQTRKWARELYDRMMELVGEQGLRPTWWKIEELSLPGVLAGAVSTAMRADAILVATDASEGMPLPFYVWVKAWLPHRMQAGGALIGLLGKSRHSGPWSGRLTKFLRAVAREARMDFLKQERALAVKSGHNMMEHNGRAVISKAALHELQLISRAAAAESAHELAGLLGTLGNPLLRPERKL